jgi:deoxyribodipyrimidine photolyase
LVRAQQRAVVVMTRRLMCNGDRCNFLAAEVCHLRQRLATAEGALLVARSDLAQRDETIAAVMADNDRLRTDSKFHYEGFKQEFERETTR